MCNAKAYPLIVGVISYVLLGYRMCTSLDETNNCTGAARYTMRAHMIG